MPCSYDIWSQATPCQDYETCANNFCKPLSCMADSECNGYECNKDTHTCTPFKSGLVKVHLNANGTRGTTVAGSTLQFNQDMESWSTLAYYSPRTTYSILSGRDEYDNMYNPNSSYSAVNGCKSCSPSTDLATINSPEEDSDFSFEYYGNIFMD